MCYFQHIARMIYADVNILIQFLNQLCHRILFVLYVMQC